MNILQRIRFPASTPVQTLYIKNYDGCHITNGVLYIELRTTVDFDSFFNSFVFGPNGWPPDIGRVICEFFIQGDMKVILVKRDLNGHENQVGIFQETSPGIIQCAFEESGMEPCRFFARIRTGDEGGAVLGGRFFCDVQAEDIRIAVVFCTYLREADVLRNVQTLCDDEDLMCSNLRVYVADNGRTIAPEDIPCGVVYLPGPNEGGAGGFNRGIREAVRQGATHIILMDDDVTFDAEAVLRCCTYYKLRPNGTAIAGVLLDESIPEIVQEAGAWISDTASPFIVRVKNNKINLADSLGFDALCAFPESEYGGFWLFAFPANVLQTIGLIAPVFFKADDIEFCLRLRKGDVALHIFAGVGVQHPGFMAEFSMIKRYYWIRNMLIVEALHGKRTSLQVALSVAWEVMKEWRQQRLHFAAPLMMGAEDFLKGPNMMESFDNTKMISNLNMLYRTLQQKEQARCPRIWFGSWYALRGLVASAALGICFSHLKKRWRDWLATNAVW